MDEPRPAEMAKQERPMRVERIEVVSTFRLDEAVVLSAGPRLQAVQRAFGGRLLTLNVPEGAPPELPRAALAFKNTLLHVGLNRFQIIMEPPNHVSGSFSESLDFAKALSIQILRKLYRGQRRYDWTGVIVALAYPEIPRQSERAVQAAAPLFSRLLKLDWDPSSLASLSIQVGQEKNGYFRNYSLSGYEEREIGITVPPGKHKVRVDMSKAPLRELGVGIQIDVNNRPLASRGTPSEDVEEVVRELHVAYDSLRSDFHLEGIIR